MSLHDLVITKELRVRAKKFRKENTNLKASPENIENSFFEEELFFKLTQIEGLPYIRHPDGKYGIDGIILARYFPIYLDMKCTTAYPNISISINFFEKCKVWEEDGPVIVIEGRVAGDVCSILGYGFPHEYTQGKADWPYRLSPVHNSDIITFLRTIKEFC